MDIAFRADASLAMGTGHLMRCLTLADALAGQGARTAFLCASGTEPWRKLVESHGHRFTALPLGVGEGKAEAPPPHASWAPWGAAADADAVLGALGAGVDWLVVDHYALDARWERRVRARARHILAVDDLADRDHECDVLLDHNPQNARVDRYRDRVPAATRRLIGPRYALLHPAFARARESRPSRDGTVRRIAIFMGGTDPDGATLLALDALATVGLADIPVDVAVGAASPHLAAIQSAAALRGTVTVHVDLPDLAQVFAGADLAIGAGGVAALERCCVGLPTVTMAVAANQEPGLAQLAAAGAIAHIGRLESVTAAELARVIGALVADARAIRTIAASARAVADGHGVERVVTALGMRGEA